MPVGLPGSYCEPIDLPFKFFIVRYFHCDICSVVVSLYKCGLFLLSAPYKFNRSKVILFLKYT
jgi:hypothetical protein